MGSIETRVIHRPTDTSMLGPRFDGQSDVYHHWRETRMRLQQADNAQTTNTHVQLNASLTTEDDHLALATLCDEVTTSGFCAYQFKEKLTFDEQRTAVSGLAMRLGLTDADQGILSATDNLSLLEDLSGSPQGRFIPYTSNAMNWHTDGYYNEIDQALRSFTLHCLQPANSGGELTVLDTELLLVALYEEDPALVSLLCQSDAMTLPGNTDDMGHDRPDRAVPVLFLHADGALGLRYTTRSRHIKWCSAETKEAAVRVNQLIDRLTSSHRTITLQSGQGIITRNILHRRESFTDTGAAYKRKMLRGRYLQLPGAINHAACQ